jgi:two-component system response regulator GlrR
MRQTKILLIDCNPQENTGEVLEAILTSSRLEGVLRREVVANLLEAKLAWDWPVDDVGLSSCLIFLILPRKEAEQGGVLIDSIKRRGLEIPIIVAIEDCGPVQTLRLLEKGASDFITPPPTAADTLPRAWRLLNQLQSRESVVRTVKEKVGLKLLIGQTSNFLAEVKKIPLVAKCDSRILIAGETGTGKEMCARAIHYLSPRAGKPFVPVNCGAIPAELVENELFGHERGAFTGANTASGGLIEEAEGGTLFLDEIDCLPLMAQVKLLRFLQEKEYRRLGSSKVRRADVRVVTAANTPLEEAVQKGTVRQDLYYRLNVVSIVLPPLRERREDIPLLACHFLEKYSREFRKAAKELSPEALQLLMAHSWPGNVRELEHLIERAILLSEGSVVRGSDLRPSTSQTGEHWESLREAKAREIARFEKNYIHGLLSASKGNITKAAEMAQKNRRAFWQLITKHHIDVNRFKPSVS